MEFIIDCISVDCDNKLHFKHKSSYDTALKRNKNLCKSCSAKIRYSKMSDADKLTLKVLQKEGYKNMNIEAKSLQLKRKSIARKNEMLINKCNDKFKPSYNIKSIPIIEKYGLEHNLHFRHALNHTKGEFKIYDDKLKKFYYADGYDKLNNVWIEYDEHRKENTPRWQFELLRENRIKEILNCKIIRLKEYGLS